MKSFELIEHTADIGVCGQGDSLAEAFEAVAEGAFSIMVDLEAVQPVVAREISAEADGLDELLVEWLSELLAAQGLHREVYASFGVRIERNRRGAYCLIARARGERLDPARHRVGSEIKGVSYLGLRVYEEETVWIAQCILDV